MASPTGSLMYTQAVRIEEILNKSLEMYLPTLDKVWEDSVVSNQSVGSADDMGRDFLINKTYMGGLTGVIEPAGPRQDFVIYGDPQNSNVGAKLHLQGLSNVFPDALQGPNQTPYRLSIPMRAMVTNIMLTLGEAQAEATKAFIGEVIAPKLEGFAKHMSQVLCNYFYVSQNTYYSLSTVGSSITGTTDTNTTIVIDLTGATFAVDRFMVGMRVQFYDTTGATLRTLTGGQSVFIVVAVDELTGKISLKEPSGAAVAAANWTGGALPTSTDIIVMAGSKGSSTTPYSASPYFTGIAGINSWLKYGDSNGSTNNADNCLLGAERATSSINSANVGEINVNVHPEFRSMQVNLSSQPLTEHTLRKILRRWHSAKNKYGQSIDCLIASDGVWLAYEAQKIGRQLYDRTGRVASLTSEGGPGKFMFEFDGRSYEGLTSTYVDANTVYGIKKNSNWKRYSPPEPRGVTRNSRMPSWVPFRFVGGALTGTGSNQIPIFSVASGRTYVTEGSQMPGYLRMQLVPDQPAGLRITNVAEDRIYSS